MKGATNLFRSASQILWQFLAVVLNHITEQAYVIAAPTADDKKGSIR